MRLLTISSLSKSILTSFFALSKASFAFLILVCTLRFRRWTSLFIINFPCRCLIFCSMSFHRLRHVAAILSSSWTRPAWVWRASMACRVALSRDHDAASTTSATWSHEDAIDARRELSDGRVDGVEAPRHRVIDARRVGAHGDGTPRRWRKNRR